MKFDEMQLLYLRRIVVDRLSTLLHKLARNQRFYSETKDVELQQMKIGSLESEIKVMESLKELLNSEIGRLELLGNYVNLAPF